MKYPVLILPGEEIGLYRFDKQTVDTYPIYRKDINRLYLRLLRNTCGVGMTLTNWKKKIANYKTIIVFDTCATFALLRWVSKHNKSNARLIFCYRNSISTKKKSLMPDVIRKLGYETWSYNKNDCKRYGMNYYNQMLDDSMFGKDVTDCTKYKYDVIFIGKEKGRGDLIKKIKGELDALGLNTYFYVTDMEGLEGNRCTDGKLLSYETYIGHIKCSKCILDLVTNDNYGLTYRPLEALFSRRKLITNYEQIADYDFYAPQNILIYDNNDHKDIVKFVNGKYEEMPTEIINLYTINEWLNNF